jgi:hypothetical protein
MQAMPSGKTEPVLSFEDPRSRTIPDFCYLENLSLTAYYKIKRRGHGPDELRLPESKIIRITQQSHQQWRERMRELAQSEAGKLEKQRRAQQARSAGKRAAESPDHVNHRERGAA